MQNPTIRTIEYVYVIKETGTNFAKIGYSANPQARLCELQTGNPRILQIVALWEGGVAEEIVWHKRLTGFRATVNGLTCPIVFSVTYFDDLQRKACQS